MFREFSRYVAIGDSVTEGMNDGDDLTGYVGWADRLAAHLARRNPDLEYANLALRGLRTHEIRSTQLDRALALKPDLMSVVSGVNDLLHGSDNAPIVAQIEEMFLAARSTGATVFTMTAPDFSRNVPLARLIRTRSLDFNRRVVEAAERQGVIVIDTNVPVVVDDPRVWSADRLHASTFGHTVVSALVAAGLGVPMDSVDLSAPLPSRPVFALHQRIALETRWAAAFAGPWLHRRLTGKSTGDGRVAKHAELVRVALLEQLDRKLGLDPLDGPDTLLACGE
ncbi:MAG: lysophospholipase [Marmoricola sp.]|nr:lysophospholipase [Marmoricola sp.]